ncbi:MAG: hypothetical protein L3J41_06690 [Melioribacteraceae bacterium]|nr:hypothetical protein [Melioribacteraceae bacterium]
MVQKTFFIILLLVSVVHSQEKIQLIDSTSKEPISDVVVYSSSIQQISDDEGYFLLDLFVNTDSISFSHIAYKKLFLSYSELELISFIELSKKEISTKQIDVVSKNDFENSIITEKIELNNMKRAALLQHQKY